MSENNTHPEDKSGVRRCYCIMDGSKRITAFHYSVENAWNEVLKMRAPGLSVREGDDLPREIVFPDATLRLKKVKINITWGPQPYEEV